MGKAAQGAKYGARWDARAGRALLLCGACCGLTAFPASAQRVTDNAVASASDAFGVSVGNERVGLYSPDDVRGFSPVDAGNARIEGIYFAPVAGLPVRLVSGNKVRVGITAQGYAFPAPTGIVDYELAVDGRDTAATVSVERGQFGSKIASVDSHWRLGADWGAYLGGTVRRQYRHEGGDYKNDIAAAGLAWRPWEGARLAAFYGFTRTYDDETAPSVFPGGDYLPPVYPRRRLLGQTWSKRDSALQTYGALARLPLGAWRIDAGLFRTIRDVPVTFTDLFGNARPDGTTANRVIVADFNNRDDVISGEVRVMRRFSTGAFDHRLVASLRGKRADRRFGGAQRIALGESSLFFHDARAQPVFVPGKDDTDRALQKTLGLSWGVARAGRFTAELAVAQSHYDKTIRFAAASGPASVRDRPLTGSLTAALSLTPRLTVYGGHVRGFEEVAPAPANAANRGSAPPAIRTVQSDLGFRYALTSALSLVAGVFTIAKPYYNVDAGAIYRDLGQSSNRGLEVSLAGTLLPGFNMVLGTVLIDARISGEPVQSGAIGPRPIGTARRRSLANFDWRLGGGKSPLSFDIAVESLSDRVGNASNRLMVPGRQTVDLGLRYRFPVAGAAALLRVQVSNLFDNYNWLVSSNGSFLFNHSRRTSVELRVDL